MIATSDERLPLLAIAWGEIKMFTLPQINSSPLKMDGWKMASLSYFGGSVYLHHIHVPSFCFGLMTSLIIQDKNNQIPRNLPERPSAVFLIFSSAIHGLPPLNRGLGRLEPLEPAIEGLRSELSASSTLALTSWVWSESCPSFNKKTNMVGWNIWRIWISRWIFQRKIERFFS